MKLATMDEFNAYLRTQAERVDGALEAYLQSLPPIPNLREGVVYALGLDRPDRAARGKRLRPVLCLLTAESLGAEGKRALPFAMAVEMLHNFLLLHDDIEDGDTQRHGRATAWVKFGRDHAINVGDYMHCLTYDLALGSRAQGVQDPTVVRTVELLTATIRHTGEGQALDMNDRRRRDMTMDDYLHTVQEKTGYYLAVAPLGGALVAGAPPAVLAALETWALRAMPVFQIADDMLDLTPAKGRGEIGSDIKEGKRSFPVVHTAHHCTPAEAQRMFDILDKPREETTAGDVEEVLGLFQRYGAVAAGQDLSHRLLTQARGALGPVPEPLRGNLLHAQAFLLERKS